MLFKSHSLIFWLVFLGEICGGVIPWISGGDAQVLSTLWAQTTSESQQNLKPSSNEERSTKTPSKEEQSQTESAPHKEQEPIYIDPQDRNRVLDFLNPEIPVYNIHTLKMRGSAEDKLATIQIEVGVQINLEDQWVKVPLELGEAMLCDTPKYKGPGAAIFAHPFNKQEGHYWWFKGKSNEHQLILKVKVPLISVKGLTRRLQLSLPESTMSSLRLEVPYNQLSVSSKKKPGLKPSIKTTALGSSQTAIEAFGLGARVALEWYPLANKNEVRTVLQAHTMINVNIANDAVLLKANQTIKPLQGSYDKVHVRLPPGFHLIQIEGDQYLKHKKYTTKFEWVEIELNEVTSQPTELKWILEAPFPKDQTLSFEGFDVLYARRQTGIIEFDYLQNYDLQKEDSSFVVQMSPEIQKDNNSSKENRRLSYKILNQPFQLKLQLKQIQSKFINRSLYFLKFSEDRADLAVRFSVNVYRGILKKVYLKWPAWKANQWQLDPLRSDAQIKKIFIDEKTGDAQLEVEFFKPKSHKFQLILRAKRSIAEYPIGSKFPVNFPEIVSSSRSEAMVMVFNADSIESKLTPTGMTSIKPYVKEKSTINPPDEFSKLRSYSYVFNSDSHTFDAELTQHQMQLATNTTVEISKILETYNQLHVSQKVEYQVAYKHLPAIQLKVPRAIVDTVNFTLEKDGTPLTPHWLGKETTDFQFVRLDFEKPQIGSFSVVANYSFEPQENIVSDQEISLKLPLIQSKDQEYSKVIFALTNPITKNVITVDDQRWKFRRAYDKTTQWFVADHQLSIPLKLNYSKLYRSQVYTVKKAFIQSSYDQRGFVNSRAQYLIDGNVQEFVMTFHQIIPNAIWWNEQRIDSYAKIESAIGKYRIQIPQQDNHQKTNLLTIDFFSKFPILNRRFQSYKIFAPEFPNNIWTEKTVWEVQLPYQQHLFTYPDGFMPMFKWVRNLVIWNRVPEIDSADLERWIPLSIGPPRNENIITKNSYLFTRLGPTSMITFASMSQAMIVLYGAGIAFVMGILLMKIPLARNMITVLTILLLLCLIGLWYTFEIQLLIQPALIGLLLAIAAASIDHYFKRSSATPLLPTPELVSSPTVIGSTGYLPETEANFEQSSYQQTQHLSSHSHELGN